MPDKRHSRQAAADRPGAAGSRPWRRAAAVAGLLGLGLAAALMSAHGRPQAGRLAPAVVAPAHEQPGQVRLEPIRLAGRGSLTTARFALAGGLSVFSLSHPAGGSFWVHLLDGRGRPQRVLAGASKPFSGSVGLGLPAGAYMLRAEAAGPWTVVVTQPRAVAPAPLPRTYQGRGRALVGPFHGRGTVRLTATYDGDGDFAVDLLRDTGALLYTVVDVTDRAKPSGTLAALQDGGYYLNVDADGPWSVTLTGTA
jgi:hypothetical protein